LEHSTLKNFLKKMLYCTVYDVWVLFYALKIADQIVKIKFYLGAFLLLIEIKPRIIRCTIPIPVLSGEPSYRCLPVVNSPPTSQYFWRVWE
jgi:hypothetical protein